MNPTEQVFSFRFVENSKGTLKDDFSFGEFQTFYEYYVDHGSLVLLEMF